MWVEDAMPDVVRAGALREHTHIFLVNTSELSRRLEAVKTAFADAARRGCRGGAPVRLLHTFAVKANPLQAVLETARAHGFGAETASLGEFVLAEKLFARPGGEAKIVFDSPVKTVAELHHALQVPCYLNLDNFVELERVVALVDGRVPDYPPVQLQATLGIRINPQTAQLSQNDALMTGGVISKFGVSLRDPGNKERLIDALVRYHDRLHLKVLHVHSGSQGLSLTTMVAGVKAVVEELADDPRVAALVEVIDIGGGFPVDFETDDERVCMGDYANALLDAVPTLFAPPAAPQSRMIITEFGRTIAAKSGVLASRVEYVKRSGGRQIILQHIGADLAVRTVWQPEKWPLRVFVMDEHGRRKSEAAGDGAVLTDVGGPCCNSGCLVARGVPLPANVQAIRDGVVVRDVGGYYHSSFSLYNLRQMPACYVYEEDTRRLTCVKRAQPVEDTVQLFMTDAP